jgi:hypothetical protein
MTNMFKVGDRVRLKNGNVDEHWILAAEIEYFKEGSVYLKATEVSEDQWLHEMYREEIRDLLTDWELDVAYMATKTFDKELQELLDD